jgi:hypothetical protein
MRFIRGVLIVIVVGAVALAAGWYLRDRQAREERAEVSAAGGAPAWKPLTRAGAVRARNAIERLGTRDAPERVSITPADLAAFVFSEISRQFPASTKGTEAAVMGDRILLRGTISPRDLGGSAVRGPLAGVLGDQEPIELGGTLHMVQPSLAEFRVESLAVHDVTVPPSAVPRLLDRLIGRTRPDGVSREGIPLPVPPYVADIRTTPGGVTLYRTGQ